VTGRLTTEDEARLNTFILEIANDLYGGSEPWEDHGDERHFPGWGGLYVNKLTGAWCVMGGGPSDAGWTALKLIMLLKACSYDEAVGFAIAWLESHPGFGSVTGYDDDEDRESLSKQRANAARVEEIRERKVPAAGTGGETYLRSRGCWSPDAELYFIENARAGESALIAPLTANGRTVGYLNTYLDTEGRKSAAEPQRQIFMSEKAPHAVIEILAAREGDTQTVICEGVENAECSSAGSALPHCRAGWHRTPPALPVPKGRVDPFCR